MIDDKKKLLKLMITELHTRVSVNVLKEKFKHVLVDLSPSEMADVKKDLEKEELPRTEIEGFCHVHNEEFDESLKNTQTLAPPGHTVNTLMQEHIMLLDFASKLRNASNALTKLDFESEGENMGLLFHVEEHFKESEKHYLREENVLFPYLEKHGVSGPPKIMWSEHNLIRAKKKELYDILDAGKKLDFEGFKRKIQSISSDTVDLLSNHFNKENSILFPIALNMISASEWVEVRKQCDEIGYCCFSPEDAQTPVEKKTEIKGMSLSSPRTLIRFETGDSTTEELEAILNTLPVDITFVDKNDKVQYFSESKDRIFLRNKAVLGRSVQLCHPQESVHVVEKILDSFKKGENNVAEFWINMNSRLIHIRYFAVKNKGGSYIGTLEVTQDVTDIKKIEGEKRLLSWK